MVSCNNEKSAVGADTTDTIEGAELKTCSLCDVKCSNQTDFDTHDCHEILVCDKKSAVGGGLTGGAAPCVKIARICIFHYLKKKLKWISAVW